MFGQAVQKREAEKPEESVEWEPVIAVLFGQFGGARSLQEICTTHNLLKLFRADCVGKLLR